MTLREYNLYKCMNQINRFVNCRILIDILTNCPTDNAVIDDSFIRTTEELLESVITGDQYAEHRKLTYSILRYLN